MVKRYEVSEKYIGTGEYVGQMVVCSDGDYVEFSDYDALAARLAEVTEERDALRVTLDMVLHIPNMTNDQLEELKARCQKIIDGATDSADEVQK